MKQIAIVMSTAVLIAASVACSSPATPSAAKAGSSTAAASAASQAASEADAAGRVVTDALSGVSMTAPAPLTPTDGQAFKYAEQPLTLVVKNATTTGATPTYTFQVAGDAAFGSLVFNQEGIAQGAGANTSVALPKLAGAKTYFWRARATSGTTVGLFSAARSFNVGPEVVLQAPVLASPGSGAAVSGTISMVTNNVQRSGPVTAITYRFDLSNTAAFSPALASAVVPEQSGTTSWSPNVTLGAGTYYWRVQAFDNASVVSSPVSGVLAFSYQPFDLHQATIVSSPQDFANWAETAGSRASSSSAIRSGWTSIAGPGRTAGPTCPSATGASSTRSGCASTRTATGTVRPWSSSGSNGISARRASPAT